MKIVFLSDDFPPESFGGAGLSAYDLAKGLARAGHEVSVVTTCRNIADAGKITHEGVTLFRIAASYPTEWRAYVSIYHPTALRELERILREVRPDIVHAHNIHLYLSYAALAVAHRYATVVLTFRDVMSFNYGKLVNQRYLDRLDARVTWLDQLYQAKKRWNPLRNFLIKRYLKSADALVAISQALQTALAQNGIAPVTVIHNGIDVDAWGVAPEAAERLRQAHGLVGKKVLLFSGRLSPAKGAEQVLEALAEIVREVPDTVLLVAGVRDAYAAEMLKAAREKGVAGRVVFTGWLEGEDLKAAYACADVVLFPSVCFDAFGRVNLEAMASKKPVISTRYGGSPEVVEDGVTGYIIDPRFPQQIAEKAVELLHDPEKARRMGEAGYARARALFALSDKVDEHIRLYKTVLANSGTTR